MKTQKDWPLTVFLCSLSLILGICFTFFFYTELFFIKAQLSGETIHVLGKEQLLKEIDLRTSALAAGLTQISEIYKVPPCTVAPVGMNILEDLQLLNFLIQDHGVIVFEEDIKHLNELPFLKVGE